MKKLLLIALLLICPQLAHAASQRNPCYTTGALSTNGQQNCIDVGTSTPLPVTSVPSSSPTAVQSTNNITPTDCSGSIAVAATAQNAFTASATRRGFTIVNNDVTEPLWIAFNGTATIGGVGSYPLAAGASGSFAGAGSFTSPVGFGMNTALSVIATTGSHKYTCTWW
jgi:hypothetical protein